MADTMQHNDVHFSHSEGERFTVDDLLGIFCPAQGLFDWIDEHGTV